MGLERARVERRRATAEGRTHGRGPADADEAAHTAQRGFGVPRAGEDDDGEAKGPLGKSQVLPIHLNRLVVEADRPVVEILGLDPDAPRELIAWRVRNGKAAILARGESDEFGQLDFPPVVAAGSGLEIVITGVDGHPDLPGASDVRKLAPRPPEPPQGRVLEAYEGEAVVRIVPTEGSGTVLLADLDGSIFARYPISPMPAIGTRAFDVVLELYGDDPQVLMAHEFTDGRRSDWRVFSVGAPTEFEDLPETEGFEGFGGFGGARDAGGAADLVDFDY